MVAADRPARLRQEGVFGEGVKEVEEVKLHILVLVKERPGQVPAYETVSSGDNYSRT